MAPPNRTAPVLLIFLLLFQTVALMPAAANPTSGTVNTFDGGQASPTLSLTGGQVDTSLGIQVPRNVTFDSASFLVSANDEVATPGQVYIDIGQDGIKEWAFEGPGYGNLGHQNSFFDGNTSVDFHSTGMTMSPQVFLPFGASVDSADVNVSFAPDVNGGLLPIGSVDDYTSGDVDNDTLPEVVVLSRDSNTTGFNAAVMIVDWTLNAGLNTSSWVQTCNGSSEVATGDFNGDGHDDLVAFSYGSDLACVHLMNAVTGAIGAAQSIDLYSNSISASAGDFDLDGYADLVSIHSGGTFALRSYDNKTSSFSANLTHTVKMNGTISATTLTYLTAGIFANNSTTFSAVVTDLFGHSTPLNWTNAIGITENLNHFDGLESQPMAGDMDGDGDIDFIGTNQEGYTIALNMGSQWNVSNILTTNDLAIENALNNASVFDHDGDGVNSLIVPYMGANDGNAQTIDGNLTAYPLNSTEIGNASSVIQPWSIPRNALGVDMNGDGLLEHIVPAGDSNLGLFIGAWNQIAMDIDSDGQDDLHAIGYAGDALYGMEPLYIDDPMGNMTSKISRLTYSIPHHIDGYGVRLCSVIFSFANTAHGTFNLSSMDIGYDADFIVENNPFASGNLTNIINQQQTAGVGDFVVTLPVNSTLSGIFAVSGLVAQYSPGAPNISLPPTPEVSVTELTSKGVRLEWQGMVDFGEDLISFEVFRAAPGVPFDLTSPYSISDRNSTVDGTVEHGTSYVYSVRSLHSYGVTSNMSAPLSVSVPFPAPPAAVTGFNFVDTPGDEGGSLDLSWNISIDGAVEYGVYLETQAIETIDALQPIATIAHSTENPIMSLSTVEEGLPIVDGTDYYAAIVAFDEYGNATTSFSALGPVISLNNSQRMALIEYDLSTSSTYDDGGFGLSALDSLRLNITLTADGVPLEGELVSLTIEASGVEVELSGTTDSSGVWQAIEAEDLTELGGTFTTFFDSATMTIEYLGTTGSPTLPPV
ncbi:VCBS repeat-containing protein, partial [Candidatus Poseidoniales archaeon]|nr:VCBS repeat-containing protein [Candidatus Poseidoniales archaeon]